MARRFTLSDEPMSKLAIWARRMALFSLCAVVVSIIIVRSDWLDIGPAITTFVVALAPSILALLLALAALVVIWTDGLRGLGRALASMAIAGALLAYPDIEPLDEDATPEVAFKASLAVVTKRKWIIIDRRPPQPGRPEGHIEAVARTLIMGLRDDVVLRVRGGPDGSRIDVRSSSRFGSFDFGSNAARIRKLMDDIDDAIGNEKPEPAVLPAKKLPAPGPAPKRDQPVASSKK
jgi:uncharacterized protein (DUF1499 family)